MLRNVFCRRLQKNGATYLPYSAARRGQRGRGGGGGEEAVDEARRTQSQLGEFPLVPDI